MSDLEEAARLLSELEQYKNTHRLLYYKPYDYQKSFHNAVGFKTDKPARQKALMAANQCITPWTVLETDHGERLAYEMLCAVDFGVRSWDGSSRCTRRSSPLFLKSIEPAFRVFLDNGASFDCSRMHRVLTSLGWISLDQLIRLSNGLRLIQIDADSSGGYALDGNRYGQRLHDVQGSVQVSPPSQGDVQRHVPDCLNSDVEEHKQLHIRTYQAYVRYSTFDDDPHRLADLFSNFENQDVSQIVLCTNDFDPEDDLSLDELVLHQEGLSGWTDQSSVLVPFGSPSLIGGAKIIAVLQLGYQPIVDVEVNGTHCYQTAGVTHHNTGKTTCGAYEVAMHLTGLYPSWWSGKRYERANEWIVASTTNETTRDRCQKDLFGEPTDDKALGTGTVPKELIGDKIRKPGVPNAYDTVLVKHTSGGFSKASFRAYEQGPKKFMGSRLTGGYWADEEPPSDVNSQLIRGLFATEGIGMLTFTPEEGITEVVSQFLDNLAEGQALLRATWDDCPHMTPERREMALAGIPLHEREMRSKGEPMIGSGRIFSIPEEVYTIEPFEIPPHFARINGLDFGWDHPFACANIAIDRESDTVYLYDGYRESRALPIIHANAIKKHGDWIPCSWPHDGMKSDPQSGKVIADIYRDHHVNMWPVPFTNPPPPNMEEGKGGNGVEAGIFHMLELMESNRFKVFKTVKYWFEEVGRYHRKNVNGKSQIVALNDDFISAVRYAVMFRRFATTRTIRLKHRQAQTGLTNW